MSTSTTDYLDLVERLPEGAQLRLQNVGWDEYEQLLALTDMHPGHRVSYDRGRLTIAGPSFGHERGKEFVLSVARILGEELDVLFGSRGSATFKNKPPAQAAEPDACFYVQNAARLIGRLSFELETDPPPDVVVEVDTTNDSLDKFHVHAASGVPEIWRYDGERMKFYQLAGEGHRGIENGSAFPSLVAADLARFVGLSKTAGLTAALKAFREEVRARPR